MPDEPLKDHEKFMPRWFNNDHAATILEQNQRRQIISYYHITGSAPQQPSNGNLAKHSLEQMYGIV